MVAGADDWRKRTGWRALLAEMAAGARDAARRFPVTVVFLLMAMLNAMLLIVNVEFLGRSGSAGDVFAFPSGALASLAIGLFCESRGIGHLARLSASIVGGLATFAVVAFDAAFSTLIWAFIAALPGLVVLAPFLGSGSANAFWLFAVRLAFAVFLAALALLLFAGGISAILASLSYLFGIDVPHDLYSHVWAFSGLFAAPLFGLGQVPRDFSSEPDAYAAGFMARAIRALGDFVAAPLLIVYAVILHAYALKIVVTREVPQGQIGWLVLAYGFCLFGMLIVISPFLSAARAPTRLLLRLWPFLLPVPLVLLAYALTLRIGEYGVTPERFLLGLFGAVTLVVLVSQIVPRLRGDIRVMAAVPAFALLFGSFGPQGALSLSLRSQTDRFLALVADRPVEDARHDEALSALRFLNSHDALGRVAPAGAAPRKDDENLYRWTAEGWGLDPDRPRIGERGFLLRDVLQPNAYAVDGYDLIIPEIRLASGDERPVSARLPGAAELSIALKPDTLVVTHGEEVVRFAIEARDIDALARTSVTRPAELRLTAGSRRITLIPSYLFASRDQQPPSLILNAAMMLRAADWQ